MSAKRVKAPPAPQPRPPPKIRHCAMALMEEGETEANAPSTVSWNKKDLLAIDCAFQVHLRRSSFSRKSGIALQDALTLIAKVSLQDPPPSLEGQSVAQGVLYHFLLATPSFYQLRRIEKDRVDSFGAAASKSGAPKETTWVLESLSSREGRSLTEDAEKSDISPKTRHDILTALKSLDRPAPTHPSSTSATRSSSVAAPNPVVLGATVEERVRARADSRKRRIQLQQTVDAKSTTSLDRTWLLRLADALWSHAASILSQRDRLVTTTKPSTTQGMVTMTVQDVVLFLQRASQTQQSSTASGIAVAAGRTPGTVTKRQMLQYFHELRRDMPGWITLSSDDDNDDDMETAPDTTVWIKPNAYKALRNKMSDNDDHDDKAMAVPTKKKRPLLADYVHKVKGQQSVFATPAAAQKPAAVVTAETPNNKQKQHYGSTAPLGIRVRSTSSAKRPAQDDAADMEEADHHKRQKRGVLRINYNLCLTEADRVGGEIIQPSFKASPRALKRLFLRMNAGERI